MNSSFSASGSNQLLNTPVMSGVTVLQREVAIMSARFAELLRQRFADDTSALAISLSFLDFRYQDICGDTPLSAWESDCLSRIAVDNDSPLNRLVTRLNMSSLEVEMLVFTGLAEEHEGFADIFRILHPTAKPFPSIGLVAQLLCPHAEQRVQLRRSLESGRASNYGVLIGQEESPFYICSLHLADQLWSVLNDIDAWPKKLPISQCQAVFAGLGQWLDKIETRQVQMQLKRNIPSTLVMLADSAEFALNRAVALCVASQLVYVIVDNCNDFSNETYTLLQLHCLIRSVIPLIKIQAGDNAIQAPGRNFLSDYPAPLILCAENSCSLEVDKRPLLSLRIESLTAKELRNMWRTLLPELADQAEQLAARYPFEPTQAKLICDDIRYAHDAEDTPLDMSHVAMAVRNRSAGSMSSGIQLVYPVSDWSQLVLPATQLQQLQEATNRLFLQSRVLDDWQFLNGRRGARGVRMLFSGPPGTGKTLSAEVLAKALGVDLLQVDLSRVVSKWIGETEKNLAEIFITAESTKAVLFFDEADALFGKRTEVSDAHDRYANLETAYLLSRLENYDGLAILATNYRQNIDAAFSRRLEFIVEFEEPGAEERLKLWQCHIPAQAPLDDNVCLQELALQFPIVGGHIRNAAVAAAFLAAQDDKVITRQNFYDAIRREYEKSGKAYREITTR